ncbi:2-amino-4-hydroxy-6-hydroxymethyldihydropteridine diphosphokinase [Verrucomicrobiaceae bacterium R5-34]|uniref:2-amino-4-hydroxy-6-hydroxymethyldihydropteridine pyrophosphokinase n=1 Tax=Oceaniferula flava TaxID=2800421 RepID=A0AAE2SB29_9BACT|nr:2-amino-4-hydroxy-6-hydroxymethyldihydropteridine diphosphokinase [Oceaniferula flavus]MBK1830342.1 2-amino-4-hydroxy-6-hydroxymethyldihydropteridine diphosphokinase [Verrucomicrobiaceae bacterium R5-34]MBK1854434.1 2-amino-4-hydroxy-6-hydroxymethyldihydropteridine diphosphokinase [Oceaniferula flavus]MBM1135740.1 2-amino-4-hydroxy-6-hydroxymethyldihydropteridine diphosphokinase [Oceaniferula flavus]
MANRVGIALGSNLGNRLTHLQVARDMLRKLVPEDTVYLQAPIYQSEPVDCPAESPDFFNTVIEIDYIGTPFELLEHTQGIEFHFGRGIVHQRNAPRIIDLDILYFGDEVVKESILNIPHQQLTSRRFVLQPLADIRPQLVLPGDTATIAEHLQHLDSEEPPLSLVQSDW